MQAIRSGLVDLVRDFLAVHQRLRGLAARFHQGTLRFEDAAELVGDSETSLLFRLKERCHSLFRRDPASSLERMRREALFDLAIGSLFHEAMKFRENFYQKEVYGPRVETLRQQAGEEGRLLFLEFEKILAQAEARSAEAMQETEALLALTREQLRLLLADRSDDGLIARYLVDNPDLVGEVFPDGLDALLQEIHGDSARGYTVAARSFLDSAFFEQAGTALRCALEQSPDSDELQRLASYAEGMRAFQNGLYQQSFERLGEWLDAEPGPDETGYASLAHAAVSRIQNLVGEDDAARQAGPPLAQRLEALAAKNG